METYQEKYEKWLQDPAISEKDKQELKKISGNEKEIEETLKTMNMPEFFHTLKEEVREYYGV